MLSVFTTLLSIVSMMVTISVIGLVTALSFVVTISGLYLQFPKSAKVITIGIVLGVTLAVALGLYFVVSQFV